MPNELENYQQKLRELKQAESEADRIVNLIIKAAEHLHRWPGVICSNAPAGAGFPAELLRAPSIDVRSWPDGATLARVLAGYHTAFLAAQNAYGAIPDKTGIAGPHKRVNTSI
jgi:hypothetical protein